ncbi:MAG: bacterial transcriptional activator domain-containing protein [Caldilineaceae bacterium]
MTIDVQTFVTLAAHPDPAAWGQAVDLYRSPLLEGVYLDNAPELENWLLRAQEQWQQQVVALFDRLIAQHTREGSYDRALRYARRLVALEPWREEAHCQVMLLLAKTDGAGQCRVGAVPNLPANLVGGIGS